MGAAVGRSPCRLGAQRGPAGPDLRRGAAPGRPGAGQPSSTSAAASGHSCASSPTEARAPFGLDASEALLELARERVPEADLRVGDMEALPYDDDTFDLVTGFNSFFFANDIVAAVREAGRVAKPGAPVVIQVWGPHERNELEAMKEIVRPFMPPRPPGTPPEPDYSQPGVLEDIASPSGTHARDRRSTSLGPITTPTRRPSGERSSLPPESLCSSAQSARTRSRTRSSRVSPVPRPQTAATGSKTSSIT